MLGSALVYAGLVVAASGLAFLLKPIPRLGVPTRVRALAVAGAGIGAAGIALSLPAPESRVARVETQLDRFVPVWQFREVHERRIPALPARAFEAVKRIRPDEILLFRTLIAIRSGGRPLPSRVAGAVKQYDSLLDIATHTTFIYLADDAPHELVVGTVVGRPRGLRVELSRELFERPVPAGVAVAAMNFIVRPDGAGGSFVSTETRVFASGADARRRFAAYWRVIYPGSALIRRMWLRAIERHAVS